MRNSMLERRALRRRNRLFPSWTSPADRFFRNDPFNMVERPLFMETTPPLNVREEKNDIVVELAAPGLKKDDFNIDVESNVLTISCDKESGMEEKEGALFRGEFDFSCFSRSVTLPDYADSKNIEARYEDGILKLSIPKKAEALKPAQRIKVQ